jgi:hypothetical protein
MQEYINHDLEAAMEKMEWKDDWNEIDFGKKENSCSKIGGSTCRLQEWLNII